MSFAPADWRCAPQSGKELSSVVSLWSAPAEGRKPCLSLPCRVILQAAQSSRTEIIVTGDCAWSGHLQQMCGCAPQPRTFLLCFMLWLWSLLCGQLSGQWAVILGKGPLEHGAKSG